jgi:hypothetical protein
VPAARHIGANPNSTPQTTAIAIVTARTTTSMPTSAKPRRGRNSSPLTTLDPGTRVPGREQMIRRR